MHLSAHLPLPVYHSREHKVTTHKSNLLSLEDNPKTPT